VLIALRLHDLLSHGHSATASVQELRPSALRSELAFRALRVLDSSPLAGSGSISQTSSLGNAAMPRLGSSAPCEVVTEPICEL
jgi:hypothetical protein